MQTGPERTRDQRRAARRGGPRRRRSSARRPMKPGLKWTLIAGGAVALALSVLAIAAAHDRQVQDARQVEELRRLFEIQERNRMMHESGRDHRTVEEVLLDL